MKTITNPKILELKSRAKAINYNSVSVNEFGELQERESLLDKRIIEGYGVIWDRKNSYNEKVIKGAYSKSIQERGPSSSSNYKIKMLYQHGEPLVLFETIEERETGLYFKTFPLDEGNIEDRLLMKLRSGVINNFSVGFNYVWDKVEYDQNSDTIIIKEAELYEISPVAIPADMNTFAIRSVEELEALTDDTEDFIKSLPRKHQLEARQLFARHKTLSEIEPLENKRKALITSDEPANVKSIDYEYLLNNFKL